MSWEHESEVSMFLNGFTAVETSLSMRAGEYDESTSCNPQRQ